MTHGSGTTETAVAFASYGVRVRVEIDGDVPVEAVTLRFPPGWQPDAGDAVDRVYRIALTRDDAVPYAVSHDGEEGQPRRFSTEQAALDQLEGEIQLYVAEFADPELFIHAGVVAWEGRAIVLPGFSFAGKTTMVTSLVKAGATYLSDEYAVFDEEGRVWPYPRRVSLRTGPHGEARRLDFGHVAAEYAPLPVGLVALLKYDPVAGWDVETLEGATAILAMCGQTVAIQRRPADTLRILGRVVEGARVIQGTRGEEHEAVAHLLALARGLRSSG